MSRPGAADPGAAVERLCRELNLDAASAAEALREFTALRGTYSLEGEALHWLACALYVACRRSRVPTVGSSPMEGNGVSLTRILRSARLSLIQFFSKMKKWMDMSNLPQEFRERVERLERNFEVSTVIFKKFEPIFFDIFQNPYEETSKPHRSRKQRRVPCNVKDLFNFCWTLFVYTKGNFRMIGDDLVNSYHLLLCCLDLIFANALLCPNRRDLLNPSFKGLPVEFHTLEIKGSEDPPCIIAMLCELHDGLLVEAKGIKEHYFKPYIAKLFDRKILKGDCLLDLCNFTENSKALNKEYEEYVLTVGDFDERVFLGADAEEEIGTRKFPADVPGEKTTVRAHMECHLQQHFEKKRSFAPSTPLTGRRYLREKEATITPVASATQSVSRLQSMVAGLKNVPSEQLTAIFESCARSPLESIVSRVKEIGETFCCSYTQSTDEQPGSHIDFAVNRLKLAEILYYKILETIMVQETRRLHGKDLTALLEQDLFHRSLLACCLEIVLFAYSSPRTFPWIIEVLDLRPFYFYKVIEVLIRSEEGLSRDMVKHLNSIEEQILESLAWTRNSALWNALEASENKVPTCEEVIFPSNFEASNGGSGLGHLPMMPLSPIIHPRVKEVRTDLGGSLRRDMQPLSPISVHERYSSPTAGSAKRRLFGDDSPKEMQIEKILTKGTKLTIAPASSIGAENMSASPGQTVLTMTTTTGPGKAGQKVTKEERTFQDIMKSYRNQPQANSHVYRSVLLRNTSDDVASDKNANPDTEMTEDSSVKAGSSSGRSAAENLSESGTEERGDLIKFYNAVYVGRVKSFALKYDITNQDHVYVNNCLVTWCGSSQIAGGNDSSVKAGSSSGRSAAENLSESGTEERGDLIKFYNAVYVGRVKSFALKYDITNQDHVMEAPPLSPFPSIRQQPVSPRRISQQHSVYSLKDINNMIKQGEHRSKKRAITIDSDTESPTKRLCQENDDVLLKRLQDVVSERANR
ncbi:hypothetical protein Nmel_014819 [Mimus melanotis]